MSDSDMAYEQAVGLTDSVARQSAAHPKEQKPSLIQRAESTAFGLADKVAIYEQRRAVFHQAGRLARGDASTPNE